MEPDVDPCPEEVPNMTPEPIRPTADMSPEPIRPTMD